MNVYLLYEDKDCQNVTGYSDTQNVIQDLGLKTIFSIAGKEPVYEDGKVVRLSAEDIFLSTTMKTVMMTPLQKEDEIQYRQEMVKEILKRKEFIRNAYSCVDEMLRKWDELGRKEIGKGNTRDSAAKLLSDIQVLKLFVTTLCELKRLFRAEDFKAKGFAAFYRRLSQEFSNEKEAALVKILQDISL